MSPSKVSTIQWDSFANIIDGKLRHSSTVHNGVNPATKAKLWDVPIADERDVNDAVAAAQRAFKGWRETSLEERRSCLSRFVDLWSGYEEEATDLLCAENGKPVRHSLIATVAIPLGLRGQLEYSPRPMVLSAKEIGSETGVYEVDTWSDTFPLFNSVKLPSLKSTRSRSGLPIIVSLLCEQTSRTRDGPSTDFPRSEARNTSRCSRRWRQGHQDDVHATRCLRRDMPVEL